MLFKVDYHILYICIFIKLYSKQFNKLMNTSYILIFGDIFEEAGVAFTPFSDCFGLVANGMIRKPTYWAFSFFNKLGDYVIIRAENFILNFNRLR